MNRFFIPVAVVLVGAAAGVAVAGLPETLPAVAIPATVASSSTSSSTPDSAPNGPTTTVDEFTVAIIGDSYTGGSAEGGNGTANWTSIVENALFDAGLNPQFVVRGLGGSGYIGTGTTGKTFGDAVAEIVDPSDDAVVIFGSRNDMSAPIDQVRAAALAACQDARTRAPNARVLIVGPAATSENVPSAMTAIRDALVGTTKSCGAQFLDPLADRWFFGADAALIGGDGVHPTDAGHKYMADRLLPAIEALK